MTYFEEIHHDVTRSEANFRLKLITHDGILYTELEQVWSAPNSRQPVHCTVHLGEGEN